ncbi:LysE family translocator [Peribacillus sp. NPDC097895]|uniref:LysE family translocator n=1 Tax=Peribacillus sp. NPDC097895 TaxID=3390619 RepID=UPI003D02CE48
MENYLLFLMMSFLLIIMPGPNTGVVIQNTISLGKKGGVKTVFGSFSGLILHILAAVFGLSAIIVQSAFIFSIFKYAGAVYLIYLGIKSLLSLRKPSELKVEGQKSQIQINSKRNSCFFQGFVTCVSNPKVAVFFFTFLPQFIKPGESHFTQLLVMGCSYAFLNLIWYLTYVYLINHLKNWIRKPSVQKVLQGATGFVLLGFGFKLAFERQP